MTEYIIQAETEDTVEYVWIDPQYNYFRAHHDPYEVKGYDEEDVARGCIHYDLNRNASWRFTDDTTFQVIERKTTFTVLDE